MKKLIAILLALALTFALAACGGKTNGASEPSESDTPSESSAPTETGKSTEPTETDATEPTDSEATEPTEATKPTDTEPPETKPADTQPPETKPQATEPPATNPPATEPPATEPSESHPPLGPGFQLGPGGIITPGGNGGGETQDVPVTDAGDLVDKLTAICEGIVSEACFTESLRNSGSFTNYFGGKVTYTEGMRVAMNLPSFNIDKHVVMLIEVPDGEDAADYAKNLYANADPNWTICGGPAESVQYAVKDRLVLFVMSSTEIADAVIAAFNG